MEDGDGKLARLKVLFGPSYEEFEAAGRGCNTILIESEGKRIIVDPGIWSFGLRGYLHYFLRKEALKPEDIDIVINTHLHFDHSDNNIFFRGKKLYVHEKELNGTLFLQDLSPDGIYNPEKYTIELKCPEYLEFLVGALELRKIVGDTAVTEDVRIIETPGHTPGSVSVLVETAEGLAAVIGDVAIFARDFIEQRLPMFVRDKDALLRSQKAIAQLDPSVVVPGHDMPIWGSKYRPPVRNFDLRKWFPA